MFIESHDIPEAGVDTDICIIGTGPAALTIAHTLRATQHDIWMLEAGPRHGTEESQALYRGKNIGLPLTAEPSPNPASRVRLTDERDVTGMPKVALDWRIASDDFAHVQRSIELFSKDVTGLGTVQVKPPSEWATHMGTTRMSTDPRRGVVDANGRVHGVRNLYVAGSSVFPTAGSGTPTLMLIALSGV